MKEIVEGATLNKDDLSAIEEAFSAGFPKL